MTITAALPDVLPNRQQEPSVFVPAMDALIASLPEVASQIDIAIAAFNFNSVTDTSNTSNILETGAGNKTFTVSLGKSFTPSMYLVLADSAAPTANSMIAQVVSYSGTSLIVTPIYVRGVQTTYTSWVITQGSVPPVFIAGASKLLLQTGNGRGTTNTKIRRFTTAITNTAVNDLTYVDSATLGMSLTVVTSGIYHLQYDERYTVNTAIYGISRNSNQLSTQFEDITRTHQIAIGPGGSSGTDGSVSSYTGYLAAGDVLRAHFGGTVAATGDAIVCSFYAERLL